MAHGWRRDSAIIHRGNEGYVAVQYGPEVLRRCDATLDPVDWIGMTVMNAPTAKDQFSFSLGNVSYIDNSYEEPTAQVVKPAREGWFAHLLSSVAEWQRRRAAVAELSMMTDRELSDIGLSRSDLARVFDPAFASDHARGRDYLAY